MIKAIIFDYGNVINTFDNKKLLENLSKFSYKSAEELGHLIYEEYDLGNKYETNKISTDEFCSEIIKICSKSLTKEIFFKFYLERFDKQNLIFEIIKKLKVKFKLGMISNTNDFDHNNIIKPTKGYELFDAITVSYQVGVMKPDKKIYLDVLKKLNLKAEECVYIDDKEQYAKVAEELGMKGIHYTGKDDLIASLKKLDIEI